MQRLSATPRRFRADLGAKIRAVRDAKGRFGARMTQAALADLLGTTQATVSRWESGQFTTDDEAKLSKLADLAGVSVAEFLFGESIVAPTAPIVGYVGSDEKIVFYGEGNGRNHAELIDIPPSARGSMAVAVRGDSMAPRFFNGDVIVYQRAESLAPRNLVHRDCVIRMEDQCTMLKRMEPGSRSGVFTLRSYSPALPLILDVRPEWAAPVTWIRLG